MAGEWLKMECATPDKPEVLALTVLMGWDDPDLTVGKLFRLWRWFDQQTTDGNARGVTSALLNKQVGVTGFIEAVAQVGWLTIDADGIRLVNFDRHNGKTAKERALTAKRVANHRSAPESNAQSNGATVTSPLAREEKKREEVKEAIASPARPTRRCPESFVLNDELREWAKAECPGIDVDRETARMRDHTFKAARSDWPAVWRNWMREAFDRAQARPGAKPILPSRHADSAEETRRMLAQKNAGTKPPSLEQLAKLAELRKAA